MFIPVNYPQQAPIEPRISENSIQKPNRVTVNRLPTKVQYRPSTNVNMPAPSSFNIPKETYSRQSFERNQQYQTVQQQHQPILQQHPPVRQQPQPVYQQPQPVRQQPQQVRQQHKPISQHQPTINQELLAPQNVAEYLLHAQMPLPNGKTFVLSDIDNITDPEFMT